MRVPSYRKHSSGQARVTFGGRDYLLGKYDSPESWTEYGRLVAEYKAAKGSPSFGKVPKSLLMAHVLLDYLEHARLYYSSNEYELMQLVCRPITKLYGATHADKFGALEFRAVREDWLSVPTRSRQYINSQMARTLRIVKWAVAEGKMPSESYMAIKCVSPLLKGRCSAPEAKPVTCVPQSLVDATIALLTQVQADMVRVQLLTGCRPGEVCKLTPGMIDRSEAVWVAALDEHKTAHRGKDRFIYIGPQAQEILTPYLFRDPAAACFSPIESEEQRRAKKEAERVTPKSCGNSRGSNLARKPRVKPGPAYNTRSYAKAIKYACLRGKLETWSPNQLRHSAATEIRKRFGLDAASVILGHSDIGVTQVYAEQDREKAIEIARQVG
ncbi:MAG: site-specific integrase [Aureliella sp.]